MDKLSSDLRDAEWAAAKEAEEAMQALYDERRAVLLTGGGGIGAGSRGGGVRWAMLLTGDRKWSLPPHESSCS